MSIWVTPLVLTTLFVAVAACLIATGWDRGRGWYDQHYYHEPAIRSFARQWPRFDLHDYRSATTPGYHLILASASKFLTAQRAGLQSIGALFTVALLAVLGRAAGRRAAHAGVPWGVPVAVCLPIAASLYVLMSGVWLLPDNAAWLGVLAILLIALRPQFRWIEAVGAGAVLVALVFTRQNHLWCAGLIWAWAWLASGPLDRWSLSHFLSRPYERTVALAWAVAVSLPSFAIIAYFRGQWHGLTPPSFQAQHAGGNLATPAFGLSLIAIYSVFFGAWCLPALARLWRERRGVVLTSAATGLILAIVPATTFLEESRKSGLWNLVKFLDDRGLTIGHSSPLIVVLSAAGAACVAAWLSLLRARERAIVFAALAGFVVAQSFNANAWQRYMEPMLLMVLALIAAGADPSEDPLSHRLRPMRLAGPMTLAFVLALISIRGLTTEQAPGPPGIDPPAADAAEPRPLGRRSTPLAGNAPFRPRTALRCWMSVSV